MRKEYQDRQGVWAAIVSHGDPLAYLCESNCINSECQSLFWGTHPQAASRYLFRGQERKLGTRQREESDI